MHECRDRAMHGGSPSGAVIARRTSERGMHGGERREAKATDEDVNMDREE